MFSLIFWTLLLVILIVRVLDYLDLFDIVDALGAILRLAISQVALTAAFLMWSARKLFTLARPAAADRQTPDPAADVRGAFGRRKIRIKTRAMARRERSNRS